MQREQNVESVSHNRSWFSSKIIRSFNHTDVRYNQPTSKTIHFRNWCEDFYMLIWLEYKITSIQGTGISWKRNKWKVGDERRALRTHIQWKFIRLKIYSQKHEQKIFFPLNGLILRTIAVGDQTLDSSCWKWLFLLELLPWRIRHIMQSQ